MLFGSFQLSVTEKQHNSWSCPVLFITFTDLHSFICAERDWGPKQLLIVMPEAISALSFFPPLESAVFYLFYLLFFHGIHHVSSEKYTTVY